MNHGIDYTVDWSRQYRELVQWCHRDVKSRYGYVGLLCPEREYVIDQDGSAEIVVTIETVGFVVEETWRIQRDPWPRCQPVVTRWHGTFFGAVMTREQRARIQFRPKYTIDASMLT